MEIIPILTGIKNVLFHDEEVEKLYSQRIEICKPCDSRKENLNTPYCGECGCPLETLLRQSIKPCKLGKWE